MSQVRRGLEMFRQEVEDGVFPQDQYSPYKMSLEEEEAFHRLLAKVMHVENCVLLVVLLPRQTCGTNM